MDNLSVEERLCNLVIKAKQEGYSLSEISIDCKSWKDLEASLGSMCMYYNLRNAPFLTIGLHTGCGRVYIRNFCAYNKCYCS